MPLSTEQQKLAETNMGLVGQVITDCVHDPNQAGMFNYDDLFQIGCVGLCKAAETYDPDGRARFSTYAYMLIRNEIYKKLEYATLRRNREQIVDPDDIPNRNGDDFDFCERIAALDELLDAAAASVTGVTAKGIAAIRLQAEGYSCKEIGQRFGGVSANNVSAWISRARKHLRNDPAIAAMAK